MRSTRGFTLIELMAVVALFALLAGLIAPRVGSLTHRTLRQRAEQMAADLELARQRAVVTGVTHRVLVDLEAGGYRIEWLATEAEAQGLEPEPVAPLDLRGQAPIPLEAPLAELREYRPVPGKLGDFVQLEDSLALAGVETPGGWIDRGEASVEFERDGSAATSSIFVDDEDGRRIVLEVLPLSDAVRIGDVES